MLFAPLTGLEVLESWMVGNVQVVELRLNTNQKNLTIEEVIGKMKRSHLDLLDLMSDDLKYSGAPDPTLLPLVSLKQEAREISAEIFNRPAEYGAYTRRALDTQQKVRGVCGRVV